MLAKTFGIYSSGGDSIKSSDELIIEISVSHIACMVTRGSKGSVVAFELFNVEKGDSDFENLFHSVLSISEILNRTFASTHLFVNNEFSLLVPVYKFNKEISTDYLNIVFGEDVDSKTHFDHLGTEPDLMNAYRVSNKSVEAIGSRFSSIDVQHSNTRIIKHVFQNSLSTASPLISVQFYYSHIIVVVIKNHELQFIQSFTYQSTDDVLYYLLNISQRFKVNTPDLVMQVSGIIDRQSGLYYELVKYFKNIAIQAPSFDQLLINLREHPSHYFTPFLNLIA